MRRVTVRAFRALVTTTEEPLQVTSHGFVVGVWYPDGTEPAITMYPSSSIATTGHLAVGAVTLPEPFPSVDLSPIRPLPKPGKSR